VHNDKGSTNPNSHSPKFRALKLIVKKATNLVIVLEYPTQTFGICPSNFSSKIHVTFRNTKLLLVVAIFPSVFPQTNCVFRFTVLVISSSVLCAVKRFCITRNFTPGLLFNVSGLKRLKIKPIKVSTPQANKETQNNEANH
jgi:hypothetical protein